MRILLSFVLIAFIPICTSAQISKPGSQTKTKTTSSKPKGPKKFSGSSTIIIQMDAAGSLTVDFEKIWDFQKGDVWKSDIKPGQHELEYSNGEYTWTESIIAKNGQQHIVKTKLQEKIRVGKESIQAIKRAAEERKRNEIREAEKRRQSEHRAAEEKRRWSEATGSVTDSRDGHVYMTVKVGGNHWMTENLNYSIPGSWCYGDNQINCDKYGRLYNYESAIKACPIGWHLPADEEWDELINEFGGASIAGSKLQKKQGV